MSKVLARRVASMPERTASLTWTQIATLLAPNPMSDARREIDSVQGVGASSIASEAPDNDAIVVHGGGPRVRVYCVFGDDAITRDGVNEDPLPRSSTGDGWRMSIPFPSEDVEWASKELAARSSRITARAVGTNIEVEKDDDSQSGQATSRFGSIDTEEFFRS